ncbi:hypothetical protein GQ44DRAFT_774631 [Phaeosphaeriaceae sp. PMI808]|nr:hypothetical protein GQ44DRAFT_774631 [Phaeosphaeriaceae sp. PMI808]
MSRKSPRRSKKETSSANQKQNRSPIAPPSPQPTPPKSPKPKSLPGPILSLHNVPAIATETDVRSLLANIPLTEYKRAANNETNNASETAFLLFPSLAYARRAFLTLDARDVMGREIRANFVNGVRFG